MFWLTAAFPREKRWPPDLVNWWIIAWAGRPCGSWRGCTLRKCYRFSPTSSGEAKNGKYVWRTLPQPERTLAVLCRLPSGRTRKSLRTFLCLAFQEASSCEPTLVWESLCYLCLQLAGHICLCTVCHSLGVHVHILCSFIMRLYLITQVYHLSLCPKKREMQAPQGSSYYKVLGFHLWHRFILYIYRRQYNILPKPCSTDCPLAVY